MTICSNNIFFYEQEFNPNPWLQFFMETGTGNIAGKAKDSKRNRHPDLKGWAPAKNR